jgi:hypothetical protein
MTHYCPIGSTLRAFVEADWWIDFRSMEAVVCDFDQTMDDLIDRKSIIRHPY